MILQTVKQRVGMCGRRGLIIERVKQWALAWRTDMATFDVGRSADALGETRRCTSDDVNERNKVTIRWKLLHSGNHNYNGNRGKAGYVLGTPRWEHDSGGDLRAVSAICSEDDQKYQPTLRSGSRPCSRPQHWRAVKDTAEHSKFPLQCGKA